jgi:hypothetical protein
MFSPLRTRRNTEKTAIYKGFITFLRVLSALGGEFRIINSYKRLYETF